MRKSLVALLVLLLLVGPLFVPPKAHAATGLTFKSVSSGTFATLALDDTGHIWAWGSNAGTFGDGTTQGSDTPKRIDVMDGSTPVTFRDVQTQRLTSMALDTTGHLWMTGEDANGAQGNGTGRVDATAWTKLPVSDGGGDVTFTVIAKGFWNGFAIDSHGSIWSWGAYISETPVKQIITDGGSSVSFKGLAAGNQAAIALDTSNRIWNLLAILMNVAKFDLADGSSVPYQFQAISTGNGGEAGNTSTNYILHTALDTDGHIWTWGNNNSGQLGDGGDSGAAGTATPTLRDLKEGGVSAKFKSLSAGNQHVLTVDMAGDIWSWGDNANGQLGDGTTNNGSPQKLTVKDDNDNPVDFMSVFAGYGRSFAIDTDGRVWGWGNNASNVPTRLKFAPAATLSVSPASSTTKLQSVTLTATVTGDLETPTGTVQFMNGTTVLGSASLTGGTATYTTASLALGAHTLSVSYPGDSHYAAANSSGVSHQVNMPAAPGLTLTPSPTSDTFEPVTVTVTPSINGSGNSLSLLKWLAGSNTVFNFASAGTDITATKKFDAASNGTYTVYAKDAAGSEVVKTINITNILIAGNPATLAAAILTAGQALTVHSEGTNVGQASASARNALQSAIDAAQLDKDDAGHRTQAQLNAATSTLNGAIATFNEAVIVAGDPAALDTAIAAAEQALTNHPEGTSVGQASESARDALQTAIDAAQDVSDDATNQTQAQLYAATTTLNGAIATFNEAVIAAGDAAGLGAAIVTAGQALTDHPEGTGFGQASESARDALQVAIDAAQGVFGDAANQTQAQLNEAAATLNDAISAFGLTVVGVVLNVPDAALYGIGDTLAFTLTYRDEVIVTGLPRLALALGADSVADTVYAEYTGAPGVTTTSLTFEYTVPEGMVDEDGIAIEGRLDLPAGAAVTLVSGGVDALASFAVPETSGIRMIGQAPALELSATDTPRTSADVTVTAAVYGEATAGNSLVRLNWLTGAHDVSDFEGGAAGASIVVPKAFTVQTNGDYTVYAQDAGGNESVAVITISSITYPVSAPSKGTTVELSPDGGVVVRVADSDIVKETQPDGTVMERVEMTDALMDQIFGQLKNAGIPTVTLVIDDSERAVNVRFPAERLGAQLAAYPNLQYEVRLNDSSFLLQVNVLDLADLASRLGVDLKDLKVSMQTSQVVGSAKAELERLAGTKGMKLVGQAVDFRIVVTGGGRSIEVTDFGGTYMARAIVMESIGPGKSYTAVVYDPSVQSFSFVPAVLGTRSDDKRQMSMRTPHNSIYVIMETTKRSFDDLNGHWAKEDVELLASKLIVQGVSDTRFSPGGTVTRAEFLTLLVRALGIRTDADATALSFADVPSSAWYASEVAAGVKAGLVKGLDSDRFDPNGTVTREQMAVMLDNALTLAGEQNSESAAVSGIVGFADENRISPWARAATRRVAEAGIVQGTADGRFEPQANATRAEAAAMLKRFLLTVQFIDG
ncbi:S-layer homology domain-containing protein [Cohnella sp. GCM10012308]|uniref:S-layer homology domain-containing protein n=1 Tax=Cohnella sp. GCM10012308 TaxID=3317329 RepID=UPI003619B8A5